MAAHAELIEYRFTAVDGTQKALKPGTTYVNPLGTITAALSGGIDRKVRLSVLNNVGTVVQSVTSELLGATSRITVNGTDYYGAELSFMAPAEGSYTLKAEILSTSGAVMQSESYPWVVDTTKPTANASLDWSRFAGLPGSIGMIGVGTDTLFLRGISDTSGIDSVQFYGKEKATGITKWLNASYDDTAHQASAFLRGSSFLRSVFPTDDVQYELGFKLTDKAGNETLVSRDSYVDHTFPVGLQYSDIWDDVTGTWIPYTPGMTVKQNPTKVRLKVPKSALASENPNGIGIDPNTGHGWAVQIVGDTAYITSTTTIQATLQWVYPNGIDDSYWRIATKSGSYTDFKPSLQMQLKPITGITEAPRPSTTANDWMLQLQFDGSSDWYSGATQADTSHISYIGNSTVITGIRFKLNNPTTYPVYFKADGPNSPSCVIPAGSYYCEVAGYNKAITPNMKAGAFNWWIYFDEAEGNASKGTFGFIRAGRFILTFDFNEPLIVDVVNDEANKRVTGTFEVPYQELNSSDSWRFGFISRKATAVNLSTQQQYTLTQIQKEDYTLYNSRITYNYSTLPDGTYSIALSGQDRYGHTVTSPIEGPVVVDRTAPTLNVTAAADISSLDDIAIKLVDSVDPTPNLTSINLQGGPAGENVNLSWRSLGNGNYALEYPIMFPTLAQGEQYRLTVAAVDAQGNSVQKTVTFTYSPRQVSVGTGEIYVPSVEQDVVHKNGLPVIQTEPLTLSDGSLVQGSYDVIATLRSDSAVPLVVNGVMLSPGESKTVTYQQSFVDSDGRINVSVRAAQAGQTGVATLLINTTAPNSPIAVANIHLWKGDVALQSNAWSLRQIIDPLSISAKPAAGVPCHLTMDDAKARAADPLSGPVCLIEWTAKPAGAELTELVNGIQVAGQAEQVGAQSLAYNAYLYNGDGSKVKIGQGTHAINVTSPLGAVELSPTSDLSQVLRAIQNVDVRLEQTNGISCALTLSADRALSDAQRSTTSGSGKTCLFEWQQLPPGLSQNTKLDQPQVSGYLSNVATEQLKWRVSLFSKSGIQATLAQQSANITVVNPPAPVISLDSRLPRNENTLVVPVSGGYVGDATITGNGADLNVHIERNGTVLEDQTFPANSISAATTLKRRLEAAASSFWSNSPVTVKVAYAKLPDVSTQATYNLVAGLAESVKPYAEISSTKVLGTEALPVTVNIKDQYQPTAPYDEQVMGKWQIRLLNQVSANTFKELAPYVDANGGTASFNVDVSEADKTTLRLVAEARLVSQYPWFERIVQSSQTAYITLLYGGSVDGQLNVRRLSGPAPFTVNARLLIDDQYKARSLGDVTWEVSADNGQSWVPTTPEPRRKMVFQQAFSAGKYLLRARISNVYSGTEFFTETMELTAYEIPKIKITGAPNQFVGSQATFQAAVTLNDAPLAYDQSVVEWSTDDGVTYTSTGPSLTLTSDKPTSYRLKARVRMANAPAEDAQAYTTNRLRASFYAIRPPRVRLSGPARVEVGKSYPITVTLYPPYGDMQEPLGGEFTLPNGSVVPGTTLDYSPTEDDLTTGSAAIRYTGWIEGLRDQGAESSASYTMRVWKYIWPEFAINYQATANVAPADVKLSVRKVGYSSELESPQYEWQLPESAQNVVINGSKATLSLNEPGDYTLRAKVTDARGNQAVAEYPLSLTPAEPWVVGMPYRANNADLREPVSVVLKPEFSGGHPLDKIVQRSFTLNGQPIEGTGFYGYYTLGAGNAQLGVQATTLMGKTVEGQLNLSVIPNHLPTCTTKVEDTSSSWIVYANCEDSDGRVRRYEWIINGTIPSVSGKRVSISKRDVAQMPPVSVVAIDDSNGRSQPVSANP
nr:Ig-like domain-containing protein [Azomonas macrocytogenes]